MNTPVNLGLDFDGTITTWNASQIKADNPNATLPSTPIVVVHRADGSVKETQVLLRIDTPIEVDYYKHGGILPFVLRQLLAA